MSRKPLSPEATEALHDVMRKACERMERRSKSDRALELLDQGLDTPTICARLGIDIHSIHTMLRCARDKRAREMVRLADEMGPNV
jgi:hypothetical protein